jgi:DNA-binding transcriptional ArsR family regulator
MNNSQTFIPKALTHINSILDTYDTAIEQDEQLSEREAIRIITRATSVVRKIVGNDSPYLKEILWTDSNEWHKAYKAERIIGVLQGLRDELNDGLLDTLPELVRGELFDNFLEMAEHLHNEGFKDAAAVIAGSSLEVHLKQLAEKYGIEIQVTKEGKQPRSRATEQINQDLYKIAGAYSLLDSNQITTWLTLRNSAAHGNYANYSENQVGQFIEWIKDFIAKNSA